MIASDNTIVAEGSVEFFKNIGRKGLNVSKKMAKNILENPGKALEIVANVGTAFASRSPKAALSSLPVMINLYRTSKGFYLGKFVLYFFRISFFRSNNWNKKHQQYTHLQH